MNKYEMYKNVPHFDLIKENEVITIPSIFMFANNDEFYPFLAACRSYECTVFFENESLMISPKDDVEKTLEVLCYTMVMSCRKIGDDYLRYLSNIDKMTWNRWENE